MMMLCHEAIYIMIMQKRLDSTVDEVTACGRGTAKELLYFSCKQNVLSE